MWPLGCSFNETNFNFLHFLTILSCKQSQHNEKPFLVVPTVLKSNFWLCVLQIAQRFHQLMKLFKKQKMDPWSLLFFVLNLSVSRHKLAPLCKRMHHSLCPQLSEEKLSQYLILKELEIWSDFLNVLIQNVLNSQ